MQQNKICLSKLKYDFKQVTMS